jgi:hypothetical protein
MPHLSRAAKEKSFLFLIFIILSISCTCLWNYYQLKKRQTYAFSLGVSVAILGQSKSNSGVPILDFSLKKLLLSEHSIDEIHDGYSQIQAFYRKGRLSLEELHKNKQDFLDAIIIKIKVIWGVNISHYIRFGYEMGSLRIILKNWQELGESDASYWAIFHLSKIKDLKNVLSANSNLSNNLFSNINSLGSSLERQQLLKTVDTIINRFSPKPG